jgi:hypothetical protein
MEQLDLVESVVVEQAGLLREQQAPQIRVGVVEAEATNQVVSAAQAAPA